MTVTTETRPGSKATEPGQTKGSLGTVAPDPVAGQVSSDEANKPIYSQKQLDTLLHSTKSEWGRKVTEAERQRDDFKAQVLAKSNEIEDVQAELKAVEQRIKDLSSDDPKKFDLLEQERLLREERRKLKAEKQTLEAEKQTHSERIKVANETMREIHIWNISAEYDNADPVKLKALCDSFEANSEEQIRNAADALWTKKTTNAKSLQSEATETPKPYSGQSSGGSGGRVPTLQELKASPPEETEKKVKSGEWVLPNWVG